MAAELKQLSDGRDRHDRALAATKKAAETANSSLKDAENKLETEVRQHKALQKEVEVLKRDIKKADVARGSNEVRLNRALEEVEKLRRAKKESGASKEGASAELRAKCDSLIKANKLLTSQKDELLAAFKKQIQLIDILKRQKLHIEAARVLKFSEDEFLKALEWGTVK